MNNSRIEKILAKDICLWHRRLQFHSGSWVLILPKPLVLASGIKRNSKATVTIGQAFDERTGRLLFTIDLQPESDTD